MAEKELPASTDASADGDDKVQVKANREKYTSTRSASGAKSLHSGDDVALALDGASVDDLYVSTAKFIGQDEDELRGKYGHLNIGMQRMNLGNRIRGFIGKTDKANEGAEKPGPSGAELFAKISGPLVKKVEAARKDAAKAKAKKEPVTA